MSSTKHSRQPHRHSGEFVHEVVAGLVPAEECERYLPFARELYATLRCNPPVSSRKHPGRLGTRSETPDVMGMSRATVMPTPAQSPFSSLTRRVVMKWFRRGLHGNLLWRIGEGLLGQLHPAAGMSKGSN